MIKKSNFFTYQNEECEIVEFLEQVAKNFIKESFSINEKWNDYPFLWNEKQSFSALVPAIHKITGIVWLEQPFKRTNKKAQQETGKESAQRFIDLTTGYKGDTCLFEVKHGWYNHSTKNFHSYYKNKWYDALEQISHFTYRNLDIFDRKGVKFHNIALIILPSYLTSDKSKNFVNNISVEKNANDIFLALSENKKQAPSLVMSYKMDLKHYDQCYPFLNFIFKVKSW
ncbi:MAG: hypothetical protein K5978_00050 [Campylobacter sp.]|nr:hypothetical protein [Campylobacter sp.]